MMNRGDGVMVKGLNQYLLTITSEDAKVIQTYRVWAAGRVHAWEKIADTIPAPEGSEIVSLRVVR